MRLISKLSYVAAVTVLLACWATTALGAATVSISSAGNGAFVLQGDGFDGVAGAKITVTYDTATLANPRIAQGGFVSAALMAANASLPGSVTMALIQAGSNGISGSGTLATITFDLPSSSPGVIKTLAVELVNPKGAKISASTRITNPSGEASGQVSDTLTKSSPDGGGTMYGQTMTQAAPPSSVGTAPASNVLGGGLVMPEEGDGARPSGDKPKGQAAGEVAAPQKEGGSFPAGSSEPPQTSKEPAESAPAGRMDTSNSDTVRPAPPAVPLTSVQERFRTYQGPKTPQALIALFNAAPGAWVRQEPPVALTDGAAKVVLFIDLPSQGKDAPSFALANASLVSLKLEGGKTWTVEALPAKGASMATVKMLLSGTMTEIPLTVAPPLPKEAKIGQGNTLTEADFILFLKDSGAAKAPRYDLNGDGKHDYIDDYIFTANYIVATGRGNQAKTKEPK